MCSWRATTTLYQRMAADGRLDDSPDLSSTAANQLRDELRPAA